MAERDSFFVPAAMPKPAWIDVEGVSTCYFDAGAGDPVILIHGGNMGAAEASIGAACWMFNIAPLAEHFHVVAFDRLGQGYTDAPLRDEDYTMAASARHAQAFLKALDLSPAHLVGHSRGAFIAARVALESPKLVRSLTLVSSSTLMPLVATNEATLMPCPMPPLSREACRWVLRNYSFNPDLIPDDWIDMAFASVQSAEYRKGVSKMVDEGLRTRLFIPALARQKRETINLINEGRLQRPTQIIWGFNDRTATYEGAFALFQTISAYERQATVHILNNAGHFVFAEQPSRFNALVKQFVRRVTTGL